MSLNLWIFAPEIVLWYYRSYTCTAGRLNKQAGRTSQCLRLTSSYIRAAVNIYWVQPDRFHNYGTTPWWNALPHELHWLCQITDGRKWSGRYPVMCVWWCRSYVYRKLTSTECLCIETTCIHSDPEYHPWSQWWCWYDFMFRISCEKQLIRKALGRWTDKASLSHDGVLLSWIGSRLTITTTCSESRDLIFLHSGAPWLCTL